MARVKNGAVTKARHKKVLKEAKGYFGSKHRLYKTAKEQLMHSRVYAYRDRRQNKRNFRKLWIVRINAACRENEISYSRFINGLSKEGITVNRKMLAEIAVKNFLLQLSKRAQEKILHRELQKKFDAYCNLEDLEKIKSLDVKDYTEDL